MPQPVDSPMQAKHIADHLLSRCGDDRQQPLAWRAVAARLGCRLCYFMVEGGGYGEYSPVGRKGWLIAVNTAYAPRVQAGVIVYGLAQFLLHRSMPACPADTYGLYLPEANPEDPRHSIAREVERLCLDVAPAASLTKKKEKRNDAAS